MQNEDFTARDFTAVLRELRGGMCEQELREELQKVVKACIETGKAGSIVLKLTVAPQGTKQAIVRDDIKSTIPVLSVQPTIMFVDDNKNLTRRDPRQMNITELIKVQDNGDIVKVNGDTGEVIKSNETKGDK